ncbi:MAG: DUF5615 family PIN-like protein [Deltaproteobacteria bacterium]|nr:DUF5615 family PIN-like protein [Deltaproteobacteria bacterium]
MKLKLDENLDLRLAAVLAARGHDVQTVRSEGLAGASDGRVFEAAKAESRLLMTLDLDFANPLRFPPAGSAGVIVVRVPRPLLSSIVETVRAALPRLEQEVLAGRLWIVEPGRIRAYDPQA